MAAFTDIVVGHDPRPRRASARVCCWRLIGLLACAPAGAGALDSASPPPATPPSPDCLFCTEYVQRLGQDAEQVLTAPLRWDSYEWGELARDKLLVIGTTLVLIDKPLQDAIQRNHGNTSDHVAARFEPFGAEYSFAVLGGFYLAGRALDDPVSQAVARDGLAASILAAGIVTPVLKEIVGRSRPRQEEGTHNFSPFSGNASFPSGHATQAFAVAGVIAEHYGNTWGVDALAYGVASLVGYARLEHNAHFLSDVIAGGLIGSGVAHAIVTMHSPGHSIGISPSLAPGERGVALSVNF